MICPNCHGINNTTADYCGYCRAALKPTAARSTLYVPQPVVTHTPPDIKGIPVRSLLRNKPSLVLLIVLLILMSIIVGVVADKYIITPRFFSQTSSNEPGLVDYTTGSADFGIIRDATITDAYIKSDNPPGKTGPIYYHCAVRYMLVNNPIPQNEVFWDRDDPGIKTNSADVYNQCERYKENSGDVEQGKPVALIVTGVRDSSRSLFRNILFFVPEDQ